MNPKNLKIAIVAPIHIEPTKNWIDSLKACVNGKSNVSVIIVDDSDGKVELPSEWDVYGYARQEEELGSDFYKRFEKFHKSSACKNFGHWIAWKQGFDVIIGLDSDCNVGPNFIGDHLEALLMRAEGWVNPLKGTGWFSRGFPYIERDRPVVANLGLWENELDIYGKDRVEQGTPPSKPLQVGHEIAHGFIPFSGMNWASWSRAIPAFCFLPNFDFVDGEKREEFRRHDDIWGGYIFQVIMGAIGDRIVYGAPLVFHDTIVDAQADMDQEGPMMEFENRFYASVDLVASKMGVGETYEDQFKEFVKVALIDWAGGEFQALAEALSFWADLIGDTETEI